MTKYACSVYTSLRGTHDQAQRTKNEAMGTSRIGFLYSVQKVITVIRIFLLNSCEKMAIVAEWRATGLHRRMSHLQPHTDGQLRLIQARHSSVNESLHRKTAFLILKR
jgi:hypothetical protein